MKKHTNIMSAAYTKGTIIPGNFVLLKGLLLVVAMILATSSAIAQAHFENIDGMRYLLDENTMNATLVANSDRKYSGNVKILEKITANDAKEYTVTALGERCFKNCDQLESITLPSSVTSLGDNCFSSCNGITSVTLPHSIMSLGNNCFSNCNNLKSITLPSSITSLGDGCFWGCSNLRNITIPSSITSLGNDCFSGCYNLTDIILPSSITSLGKNCFYYCSSLTSLTLPSSITSLGAYCFYGCSNLTSITIPSSITSLRHNCFSGCYNLTNITLPSSITSLGSSCFSACSNLTSITIPSSITSLGRLCFQDCPKLESIYFKGMCPERLIDSGFQATCIFYVPKEYLQSYKDAISSKYSYIYTWDSSKSDGDDKPIQKCGTPTISYTDGSIIFSSPTIGAEYHYTITDADMASDKLSENGKVSLAAAYKISVYATADGCTPSDRNTATLYWINANLKDESSTNINQTTTRGIMATSNGGIVTISGLNDGEVVTFLATDGKQVGMVKAENGTVSFAVTTPIVIAKVSSNAIKIAVK